MEKVIDRVDLFCKSGSKDAVYHAQLVETQGGYVVNFQNGRAGGTLASGTRMKSGPVALDVARKAFDKLVREKTTASPPYQHSGSVGPAFMALEREIAQRSTGLEPQLLNDLPDDPEALKQMIEDDNYVAQQKFDGERRMARLDGSGAIGSNRRALAVALPCAIVESLKGRACTLDGEIIGETLYVFDLLSLDGVDLRNEPYRVRKQKLDSMEAGFGPNIRVAKDAVTREEKQALFDRTLKLGQEGVVFKHLDAPYASGRPNSGGPQLRHKHWAEATVIAIAPNEDRSSVKIGVVDYQKDPTKVINVGNVTVPVNKPTPAPGTLIEVRYLYAFENENGCLFIPTYKDVRSDVDVTSARYNQLKFKKPHQDVMAT